MFAHLQRRLRTCVHQRGAVALPSAWSPSRSMSLSSQHVNSLIHLLGESSVLSPGHDAFEKYIEDWTKSYRGGGLVCFPRNTEQVSAMMKYCHQHGIAVVPQGGNTSLCGGAVGRNDDEIILSFEKMANIGAIDVDGMNVTCEAGCVLAQLDDHVAQQGFMVPLDLGAKGSCMIGGNLATNAGGLRVIKYGSISKNVLGLEVVLADGRVLNMMSTLLKDNVGFDLKGLFLGSEGTLGIITKAVIKLAVKPSKVSVLLIKVPSFEHVPVLLRHARQELGDVMSAFEFIDSMSISIMTQLALTKNLFTKIPASVLPEPPVPSATHQSGIQGELLVLMECTTCDKEADDSRFERFLESCLIDELAIDAIVSKSVTDEQSMWNIRENVPLALMQASRMARLSDTAPQSERRGKLFKYDISLNLGQSSSLVAHVKRSLLSTGYSVRGSDASSFEAVSSDNHGQDDKSKKLTGYEFVVCTFGHAGDQNVHLNILLTSSDGAEEGDHDSALPPPLTDKDVADVYQLLDHIVYGEIIQLRGSISAEHGVGQLKKPYLPHARSREQVELMKSLKSLLDPQGILNPGKVLPALTGV